METWDNKTLTVKLRNLCKSVEALKKLYKPVWGLVTLFIVFGIILSLGAIEVRDSRAKIGDVRELHIKEYQDLEKTFKAEIDKLEEGMNKAFYEIGKDLGRNEASHIQISSQLERIERALEKK
jgi:hypothetical protein